MKKQDTEGGRFKGKQSRKAMAGEVSLFTEIFLTTEEEEGEDWGKDIKAVSYTHLTLPTKA